MLLILMLLSLLSFYLRCTSDELSDNDLDAVAGGDDIGSLFGDDEEIVSEETTDETFVVDASGEYGKVMTGVLATLRLPLAMV